MTATERLAEIKTRAEAATEGPWDYREEVLGMPNTTVMAGGEQVGYVAVGHFLAHNAKFIAASRADVPSLVAALEAVLDIDPGEPACAEDVGYYDGIMAARRAINEALGGGLKRTET